MRRRDGLDIEASPTRNERFRCQPTFRRKMSLRTWLTLTRRFLVMFSVVIIYFGPPQWDDHVPVVVPETARHDIQWRSGYRREVFELLRRSPGISHKGTHSVRHVRRNRVL